jgi:hypothetical protein
MKMYVVAITKQKSTNAGIENRAVHNWVRQPKIEY